jgi:ATP phosphoribosyltransferase involved in histidine biosynthesis
MENFVNAVSEKSNIEKYYFDNDFGPSIEFYDGMMFEIYNPDNQSELISGGRYDKFLIKVGSKSNLSAVALRE